MKTTEQILGELYELSVALVKTFDPATKDAMLIDPDAVKGYNYALHQMQNLIRDARDRLNDK